MTKTTSQKPYILSVDDEPVNQLIVTTFLQNSFELAFATNGHECLDSVAHRKPDLILMDINMPRLNGLDTCRKIRSNPLHCQIPIIFVSTSTLEQDKRVSRDVGGDDYMVKPLRSNALNSKINQYLKKSAS